uniref:Uncharacterized protein n=1 Tax=uncultured Chloroflexota bacterium TaxID=166587 RepID=H5SL99_9CHLR|nr:hypothetical protein HGMM_F45G04C08 [uncultured Chloroflexota bacterium]
MRDLLLLYLKRPQIAAALGLIVGLFLGLLWGWVIQPVEWRNATPEVLRSDYQEDYLRMAIDSFRLTLDPNKAAQRWEALGAVAPSVYQRIQAEPGAQDPLAIEAYGQLVRKVFGEKALEVNPPSGGGGFPALLVVGVAGILILAVLAFAGLYLYRLLRKGPRKMTPALQAQELSRKAERTDYESLGVAPPVSQTLTTYVLGDNLYDVSFGVESPSGKFLGEYGVGISKTIGVGDPKKVTALEVWLYDQSDIKTATTVLMSRHAYQDEALRNELAPKGDLVLIQPGGQYTLETANLQLLVKVVDLSYGEGALPPQSFFERVTLELAVWQKNAGA